MSNITLEEIDLVMQRANVSYSEAKEALEQCGGDTVEALLLLEKAQKIKVPITSSDSGFKNFINRVHSTSFIISKNHTIFIDIPLTIAFVAFLFCFHLSIIGLIFALILGFKVEIKQPIVADKEADKEANSSINLSKK